VMRSFADPGTEDVFDGADTKPPARLAIPAAQLNEIVLAKARRHP